MEKEQEKISVKVNRFPAFIAGALLSAAALLVSGSSWFLQFSQPVAPYIEKASEYAQKASEVSQGVASELSGRLGAASSGLQSTIATSSQLRVGPQAKILAFTASTCVSRVISTAGQAIQISFGTYPASGDATTTPASGVGHIQAASTNVVYDSGIYGCGNVGIFGESASTTITVSEFR